MAAKKDPTARRAREAARRIAAAERIGPRPPKTARPKRLYDLKPPGTYYCEWDTPVGTDEEVTSKIEALFGADSDEALTARFLLEYRGIYGPRVPLQAAQQLDRILTLTDLCTSMAESLGTTPDEARETIHDLHARGVLLIADDHSLWMTVPPGTSHSAPHGQWTFVEQKAKAPQLPI
ncbi:hypothetical protein ACEZDB_35975 [Streptacidiphilus sp. N1-3]|uniref:Uncharacterized protein n=1 Tax=Streptacidiphilus alkalitolerans TaxID=3342712 RepID=A0ABV6XCQ3_9ACTN